MIVAAIDPPLPRLRQELQIEPGAPLVTGAPSWTLFDPVRHAFFQLGRLEFRVLSHWGRGSANTVRDALIAEGIQPADASDAVARVVDFSLTHSLTERPPGDAVATLAARRATTQRDWWQWLLDRYLFVRVPLVRPAGFLRRTLPHVAPIASRLGIGLIVAAAVLGLFLVTRQWDVFTGAFRSMLTANGLIQYAIALAFVKVLHEFGHAFTATHFGCHVPTMGVSFLVMVPVFYTDTTGAWRLTSRRQRMLIDGAGMMTEIGVAACATLLWVMLDDGPLRAMVFVLASTSWIMSLAINLNPLMRFDGYYLLSDAIGVPNLQARAFALGRWKLRELLFGLGEAPPETMPRRLRTGLIAYAAVVTIYRLLLYLGIALLVYHFFFKALGVLLFIVEIAVFVVRPIFSEVSAWRARRDAIAASPRARKLAVGLGLLAFSAFLPLDRSIDAAALLSPINDIPIVVDTPAQVVSVLVENGQKVTVGTPVAVLDAPEITRDVAAHRVAVARLDAQLARVAGEPEDLSNRGILERERMAERDALDGLARQAARMVLRAPIDGRIVDMLADVHPGRWIGAGQAMARIVGVSGHDVQAFIREDDIRRLQRGALGRFVPNDPSQPSRRVKLVSMAPSATTEIDLLQLAAVNGGTIDVDTTDSTRLKPRKALFRARLMVEADTTPSKSAPQPVAGIIRVEGKGVSLISYMTRLVGRTFAREVSV